MFRVDMTLLTMRKIVMPVPFDAKTIEYTQRDEDGLIRGRTNPETWSLIKDRYVVLRDFIPKEIIRYTMDIWKAHDSQGLTATKREVRDITYKNPESSIGKSKGGYCTPWGVALHGFIHNKLKDYIDLDLRETYSYTRMYERGAYLGTHTDRPSCEISATLCLDYQTDDNTPWKIWVQNNKNYANYGSEKIKNETQDLNQRDRIKAGCKSVSLEPGDILCYQGPNIPHWRDYLVGDYSYHVFVHFFNAQSKMTEMDKFITGSNHDIHTAQPRYALELDGRPNRWTYEQTHDEFQEFDEYYYTQDYENYVNNYDDWKLVEKKRK